MFCKLFNPVKSKAAQITLPAILLIPTILLVIYLLFETTKLSREKIRHQFALDSAAFVEMTSTSNFLNAISYTNGAFPFRLFREIFPINANDIQRDPNVAGGADGGPETISTFDLFYQAGAFPAMPDSNSSPRANDTAWVLRFNENSERSAWNTEDPSIDDSVQFPITSEELVEKYLAHWNMDSIQFYMFMYFMLSQIYENQKKVYDKISADGEFFRKSYYLNTGNCRMSECGKEGALEFKGYAAQSTPVYIKKIVIFYKDEDGRIIDIPMDLKDQQIFDGRLFQFSYLTRGTREKLRQLYKGIDIRQKFVAPNNYFNVNLSRYNPRTHVRVSLQCTKESNNCVWPEPTPKYQVRLFP